jgi:hypothetical protein
MTVRDALVISNITFVVLVALAFVVGGLSLFLNSVNERAHDRELAAYQTRSELRIQRARADAAATLQRAIDSETENLRTRERTALLMHDTAAMQAQTASQRARAVEAPPATPRLGYKAADRTLSTAQRAKMISVLIERPGQITIVNGRTPEAEQYAAALTVIFRVSRWSVDSGVVADPRVRLPPLSLVEGSSEQDTAVRRSFAAAGVEVADQPPGPMDRPGTLYVGP